MKELLQQTVGNELIHCQKLSGKTKHIQKKKKLRPGPNLKSWAVSDIKKKQALFQQKSHSCGAQPAKGGHQFLSFYYFTP